MPSIAVINQKGGAGKSTIAVHLARWLQKQNKSVLLVDADAQC
ncbi:MAG: ParA family protein, partial [Rhizonema sp. PD38]|nr:ParA family protein [Rhizonema sp. PD38]